MDTPGSMTGWAIGLKSPDPRVRDEAALRIWERYSARLAALVRRNLNERIRRREGVDDVLQSMYLSFCSYQKRADQPPGNRDELWRLLVRITMCKVANTAQRNRTAGRDVFREQVGPRDDDSGAFPRWMLERMDASGPTPDEAVAVNEEFYRLLDMLPEDQRRIALWRFEGYTNAEIAGRLGRTVRTVELKLQSIRGRWEARARAGDPDGPR
jgi:DNA-directed RNA polymerase specialized sigma24 family protein